MTEESARILTWLLACLSIAGLIFASASFDAHHYFGAGVFATLSVALFMASTAIAFAENL